MDQPSSANIPKQSAEHTMPSEEVALVRFPTDHARTEEFGYQGLESDSIDHPPIESKKDLALLIACWGALLFRYSQQPKIPLSLRLAHAADWTSVQFDLSPESTIDSMLHESTSDSFGGALPTEMPTSDHISTPNMALLVAQHPRQFLLELTHELVLVIGPESGTFIHYNGHLFERSTISRISENLSRLIQSAIQQPNLPISQLDMLSMKELEQIKLEGPTEANSRVPSVVTSFEDWSKKTPHGIACYHNLESLTYQSLSERSNQLANFLIREGVGVQDTVAVCLAPSIHPLTTILAVLKTGAVYLPIDASHPPALISQMLEVANPTFVITQRKSRTLFDYRESSTYCVDAEANLLAEQSTLCPAVLENPNNIACLFFTSGTTGRPKGVGLSHANIAYFVQAAKGRCRFVPTDKFCSIARHTFSISLFELLVPLCSGASVRMLQRDDVLNPAVFVKILEDVTILHAGPSLLSSVFRYTAERANAPKTFPQLRHVSSGGDVVPPSIAEEMKYVFSNAEIFIIYGSSEISCMGTVYEVERSFVQTRSLVGQPFGGTHVRLLDERQLPVPMGAIGEICFAGDGVFAGYFNQPELDAEKFMQIDGNKFFRTGDLGRLDDEGNIDFLGRQDFQVQIRGIRVELIGIENTIRELGLATTCAVILKKLGDHDVRLLAFLVQPKITQIEQFRRALAEHLPYYMLPQYITEIERLPLTGNGKLDRRALDDLPWTNISKTAAKTLPRNLMEEKISHAFRIVLELESNSKISIDDNFFDIGGHSLLVILLADQLIDQLGISVPTGLIFEAPTVRALAEQLENSDEHDPRPILLSQENNNPALFMIAGVQLYQELARRLDGHYTLYGVYANSELALFETSTDNPPIQKLAAQYIRIIRKQQPVGPYRLGGISFGGIIAYEIAQQLRAMGEEVRYLALLDTDLPAFGIKRRYRSLRRKLRSGISGVKQTISTRLNDQLGRLSLLARRSITTTAHTQQLELMEEMRQNAYRTAAVTYSASIRPWPNAVTLIVAQKRMERENRQRVDCGWLPHTPRLETQVVNADHLEIVQEPWVKEVAGIIRKGLERAED